eukprot:gnl/Chilomastix_cuspidata/2465.p1 GENE.gnl/Chilomastix_cuspidata/2465~~gnl/Chilomastix_cuspidata/2465.p1  ORF type:complete len:549 (+),score=188.14 gnl/Chilomastix_cuspidata/2465:460-2106(+)
MRAVPADPIRRTSFISAANLNAVEHALRLQMSEARSVTVSTEVHLMCPLHKLPLASCCITCSSPLCEMCTNHIKHDIKTFVELQKDIASDFGTHSPDYYEKLAAAKIDTTKTAIASMKKSLASKRAQLQQISPLLETSDSSFESDLRIIDATLGFLNAQRLESKSRALRWALAKAKENLDVEGAIHEEFARLELQRDILSAEVDSLHSRVDIYRARLARLERVATGACELCAEALTVLLLCDDGRPAFDFVETFEAFPDALELDFVIRALAAPLIAFNGLRVSAEAPCVKGVSQGRRSDVTASLSADGTLCATCWEEDGFENTLHVFNLRTGTSAVRPAEFALWACAFDGVLFLGMLGSRTVSFAPLARVLEGFAPEEYESFDVPQEVGPAVTDRARDGWLVYITEGSTRDLVHVDLRARSCRVVECDRKLGTIGGLAGLRVPGVLCTAKASDGDEAVVAVFEDGRTESLPHPVFMHPSLLLSTADPANLLAAAATDERAHVGFRGTTAVLTRPVRPASLSLVRVYRDVFLCFCTATRSWVALRISVP